MKKKALSLLVAFAMLFSMLPTTALAVESDGAAENGGAPAAIGTGANGSGTFENSPDVEIGEGVTSVTVTAYEDGKPAVEGMTNEAVDALTNVTLTEIPNPANQPAGNGFTGYTSEDAIWGEVWGNVNKSFVIKVLDGNGNVMGTTSLNNIGGIIGGDVNVTWSLKLDAESNTDSYWAMEWTTAPSIDNQPAEVELWIDGVKVSSGNVVLNSPDGLNPVFAAKTDADGNILRYISCAHNADASTVLADAISTGDNIAILIAGTYAPVFSGKNVTITGAVDDVVFDNIGAYNMDSANVTFNNVTFNYYPNVDYTGLQHSGNLTYYNCTINGQVFLYGTSETFNNCTFNQNSADAYNVWTYGAKEVAFNECTFNSAGKSVLIYGENGDLFNDVTVTDCKFVASAPVDGKAAIEMDSSLTAGIKLTIDAATTANGFDTGSVSGNSLWNNKKGSTDAANNDITVVVDGTTVLKPVVPGLSGAGTVDDPYLINNLAELIWFRDTVNTYQSDGSNQFKGKHVKLNADIDLDGINWDPIGSNSADHGSFKGVFDGNGHTISNLYVEQAGGGLGLFARTGSFGESEQAVIKDLTLNNVTVKSTDNANYVGGVVGNATTTYFDNVHVTGKVEISGRGYIGGIAGHGYSDFNNVSVKADEGSIISSTFWCAGGIVGYHGEGSSVTNAVVEGLTIKSAAGGIGAVAGMSESNDGTQPCAYTNLSAKNVAIQTYTGAYGDAYAEYALGYLVGGDAAVMTGTNTVENVTFSCSNGNTAPAVSDAVASIGTTIYSDLQPALNAAAEGAGNITVEILRDIDLTNVDWTPVTVSAPNYPEVTVNGNGKTITGLKNMLFAGTWAGGSGLIINDLTIKDSEIKNDVEDTKGNVGVGAFIGFPQASATITLKNCHLVDSTVSGGHWTGGLIGYAAGYSIQGNGPVFTTVTISDCSVTRSTITGKGSCGGVVGHATGDPWTKFVIENTTVADNTIRSTGDSAEKAGSVMGTIGCAGQEVSGKTGGVYVDANVARNSVTSNETIITTIYGRQGNETGVLTITGGTYDAYPIEKDVDYAKPAEGYAIVENEEGEYELKAPSGGSIESVVITHDNGVLKNAVSVELKDVTFTESVAVKLYSGDTLLTTATLQGVDPDNYDFLTCCIATETADANWALTPWTPKDDVVPNKTVLVVDGQELDTKTFTLDADEWAALPGTAPYSGSIESVVITHDNGVLKNAVSVDLKDVNFESSVQVRLYSGDTLLTTATLQGVNPGNYGFLTCCIATETADANWALTPWTPKDNVVPNKTVLVVDGQKLDTKTFTLDADEWAALPGTAFPYSGSIERVGITHDNGVLKNAVSVDLKNVNFESSVQVQLYRDETLLTTATLKGVDPGNYGFLTCCIATETADANWALTPWTPKDNVVPNKTVLVVDGQKLDTKTFTLDADEWAALPGTAFPYSGSSSSGSTRYTVSVDAGRNGDVTVSPSRASRGQTVTITVEPDDGYELDELTVTDKNGDAVKVKKVSDTKYTFTMPASKVTVEADFAKIVDANEDLPFVDVAEDAYYYDAVTWALDEGITGGTSATTFSPNASCTRAQTVTFLWRAAGSPAPKSSVNPFTDVSADAYYYNAVLWAVEQGITVGTSATTFSPDATVTRAQNVTFLWRWAESPAAEQANSFTDVAADAYYYGAVAWAAEEGITGGTSATTFSPNADCTRAQIVTFLYRYLAD